MSSEIRYYLSIFMRRLHYFLLIFLVVTAAGVALAVLLPTKYRADALLLVESPEIPDALAASTVETSDQEQLEILQQRLLTRSNLLEIADQFDVFENRRNMFPDEVVTAMRDATSFSISTGRDTASLVNIAFEAERPQASAQVVNAYISRVVETNIELRTGRAVDTSDFFRQETTRLGADLASQSARILDFKNANIESLPESLTYKMDRLDDLRDRRTAISTEILQLRQQRERLILVSNLSGSAPEGQDLRSPAQRELDTLRGELANALIVFSPQNPRVQVLQNKIASLEASLGDDGDSDTANDSPAVDMLTLQLDEIDQRIQALERDGESIESAIAQLEVNVAAIPGNSVELQALERDYNNIKSQYDSAVARAAAAATGERIELLSKGGRISVVSQPVVPREPTSPNRPLIAAAGTGLGMGLGLGFVVLLELMNRAIRRPIDLTRNLGITPLATLPLIRTPRETVIRRFIVVGGILFSTAAIVAAISYVHVFVAPLDLIIDQAIQQVGL